MINAIELYGTLILTLLGFIVPILTILLSLFPQGTKSLALKYENERKQSEENISNEIKKKETEKGLDYDSLKETLKGLEKKRSEAKSKLEYLHPGSFLFKTTIPFIVAFMGVLLILLDIPIFETIIVLISSIFAFVAGVMTLFTSISVLFEVGEITNQAKNSNEEKIIELLSILVENSGTDNLYLKEDEIKVKFGDKNLKENEKFDFSVNTQHKISIRVHNSADKMAKNIEVGFVFPKDVLIEKTSNLSSIFTDESIQIVRFKNEIIQAHESNDKGALRITFLKPGEVSIDLFIKGENVKYKRFSFKLNIIN
ncbi:MAG: hypothetical protein AAB407_02925 [Patescibacteria group bacterium]